MRAIRVVASFVVAAGCYDPPIPPCTLRCDPLDCADGRCCGPAGTCRADGMCYASDSEPACGWESIGPEGGNVAALVRMSFGDTHFTFAAGAGGIMRSRDDGATWYRGDWDLDKSITAIAFEDDDPNTAYVYAGASDGRLFQSQTLGVDWIDTQLPLSDHPVAALATGPQPVIDIGGGTNPHAVYVARGSEIWKSVARGASFEKCADVALVGEITAIAVHPINGGVVFGTAYGELFQSGDGCRTWDSLLNPMDVSPLCPARVEKIEIAASDARLPGEGFWYAAESRDSGTAVIRWQDGFHCHDCGPMTTCGAPKAACSSDAWPDLTPTLCSLESSRPYSAMSLIVSDPRRILLGSTASGIASFCADGQWLSWFPPPFDDTQRRDQVDAMVAGLDGSGGDTLIAGLHGDGIVRFSRRPGSDQWGLDSQVPDRALRGHRITQLTFADGQAFIGAPDGVYVGSPGPDAPDGAFSKVLGIPAAQPIAAIAVTIGSTAFASLAETVGVSDVMQLANMGGSWQATTTNWHAFVVASAGAVKEPTQPQALTVVKSVGANPADVLWAEQCGMIYRYSANSWLACARLPDIPEPGCTNGVAPPVEMLTIGAATYIATADHVYRATVDDPSTSCPKRFVELPASGGVTALASDGAVLYVATTGGRLQRLSLDELAQPAADLTVEPLAVGERIVAVAAPAPGEIVITTDHAGHTVYSQDAGASWTELPTIGSWITNVLAADPSDPTTIYAGTDGRSVVRIRLPR